jgi:redox-sensitive bicupin YhaK (pirin superfamily)
MGPSTLPPNTGFDVRPHPHIGLATVTYLFDGEIVHRDSLGVRQSIEPGAVNLMIAGAGITHSERASDALRTLGGKIHGVQLWVALEREHEACEPSFAHYPARAMPSLDRGDTRIRVLLGEAYGARSPAQVSSRALLVDARLKRGARLTLPENVQDVAFFVVDGEVYVDDRSFEREALGVRAIGARLEFIARTGDAHVVIVGGDYLDGRYERSPRLMEWNFVASTRERIDDAKRRWVAREFPRVPGDEHERIPLPGE